MEVLKKKPIQNADNVELERKKASQIIHYLMERRQETEYKDPFELLKNMNDVIMCYEPKKTLNQTTIEATDERPITSNQSSTTGGIHLNSSRWAQYKNSSSLTGTHTSSFNLNKGGSNKFTTRDFNNDYNNQSGDYQQSQSNTTFGQQQEVQLPSIVSKKKTFQSTAGKGFRSTKTFLSKQEERILDINNIPEVNQMYENIEYKYDRIKKLKEEFNEIKTQFGITNKASAETQGASRRLELKSRGSNNQRSSFDDKKTKIEAGETLIEKPQRSKTSNQNGQQQPIKGKQQMKHLLVHNGNKSLTLSVTQDLDKAPESHRVMPIKDAENSQLNSNVKTVPINKAVINHSSSNVSFGNSAQKPKMNENEQFQRDQSSQKGCISAQDQLLMERSKFVNTTGYIASNQIQIQKVRSQALERFNKLYPKVNNQQSSEAQPKDQTSTKDHSLTQPQIIRSSTTKANDKKSNNDFQRQLSSQQQQRTKSKKNLLETNSKKQDSLQKPKKAKKPQLDVSAGLDKIQPINQHNFYEMLDDIKAFLYDPNKKGHIPDRYLEDDDDEEEQEDIQIMNDKGQDQSLSLVEIESLTQRSKSKQVNPAIPTDAKFKTVNNEDKENFSRNLEAINEEDTHFQNYSLGEYDSNGSEKAFNTDQTQSSSKNVRNKSARTSNKHIKIKKNQQPLVQTAKDNNFDNQTQQQQQYQQHAGVSLYEQYKLNQMKQMKMLKKQQKRLERRAKQKNIVQSVESIYMREAILAMINQQNPMNMNVKRISQHINLRSKSRKGNARASAQQQQMRTKSSASEHRNSSATIMAGNIGCLDPVQILDNSHIVLMNPSKILDREEVPLDIKAAEVKVQ